MSILLGCLAPPIAGTCFLICVVTLFVSYTSKSITTGTGVNVVFGVFLLLPVGVGVAGGCGGSTGVDVPSTSKGSFLTNTTGLAAISPIVVVPAMVFPVLITAVEPTKSLPVITVLWLGIVVVQVGGTVLPPLPVYN